MFLDFGIYSAAQRSHKKVLIKNSVFVLLSWLRKPDKIEFAIALLDIIFLYCCMQLIDLFLQN